MTVSPDPHHSVSSGPRAPAPLTVAAAVAALEGAAYAIFGLSIIPAYERDRILLDATTVLFFLVYGGFLAFCAVRLYRLHSWARAPLVLAQLIQILVGAGFWGGSTTAIAVLAIALAVLALVGVFHPASLAAVEEAG